MAGLVPGHPRLTYYAAKDVDARHKAGHDGEKLARIHWKMRYREGQPALVSLVTLSHHGQTPDMSW
jgi:hypothetical protein